MAQIAVQQVLSVQGVMRPDKRVIHFNLKQEQDSAVCDGRYQAIALLVPVELRHSFPVWLISLRPNATVPKNFWTARVNARRDGLFAVWVHPEGDVRVDAVIGDLKQYESWNHVATVFAP